MKARLTAVVCLSLVAINGASQVAAQTPDERGNAARTGTGQKTVDICEALQNAVALNGSEVVIRGYFRFGMEVRGLCGRDCPKRLIVDDKERPQAFSLKDDKGVHDAELVAAVRKLMAEKMLDLRYSSPSPAHWMLQARRGPKMSVRSSFNARGACSAIWEPMLPNSRSYHTATSR
jgi:hypothetical protein